MQNFIEIPENVYSEMFLKGWNLGKVRTTEGINELIDRTTEEEFSTDLLLEKHFRGDYGLVSADPADASRAKKARAQGRSFTSIWQCAGETIKIVTIPSIGVTTMCLRSED